MLFITQIYFISLKSFSLSKKIKNNLNMAITPMLQFIKPPEILEIGGDIEKFLKECDRFFELTQTAEEHRGLFTIFLLIGNDL